MTPMPTALTWDNVGLRLTVTVLVSLVIGYNRSEHGKAAGMRTTLLVCLAASVTMILVNILLPTAGRPSNSFVMNDLMRLPLGVLTGVGFIGGGAIARLGSIIVGVTTAATIWLMTVVGLCIGGGQIALGLVATGIGIVGLWAPRWVEDRLRREHRAEFSIEVDAAGPGEADVRRKLIGAGLSIMECRIAIAVADKRRKFAFDIYELRYPLDLTTPNVVHELAREPGVVELEWRRNPSAT